MTPDRQPCSRCGSSDTRPERGLTICNACDFHTYWPPTGEHAEVWERWKDAIPDGDKHRLIDVLVRWRHEHSTLVAYTDENGEWVEVEPLPNSVSSCACRGFQACSICIEKENHE